MLLAIVSTVTACVTPNQQLPDPIPGPVCTEIGCESLLVVDLVDTDILPEETYQIEVCVDGTCVDESVTVDIPGETGVAVTGWTDLDWGRLSLQADDDLIEFTLPPGDYDTTAVVSVTVADAAGSVIVEGESEAVPLERAQPNGPDCPPVCFTGRMQI